MPHRATRNEKRKQDRPARRRGERPVAGRGGSHSKGDALKQTIFDSIPAQIVVVDSHGAVIDANRSWRELLGTDASASPDFNASQGNYLEGWRRAAAAGSEGAMQILETVRAVIGGRASIGRIEYRGRKIRGREQCFVLTATALPETAGAVLLHENISLQRQLEGEILEISERERAQFGQELHDGLCQHLGGVALLAKTLSNALANAGRPEAPQAAELAQLIYSAVGETRSVARGLRPVELDEDGLPAALQDLADQASARVACEFRINGRPRVSSNEVATNLYRIAKEAVANAARHSNAAHVVIRLRQSADHLTLAVEDDGAGFCGEADGMGLRIMRYRANSIGARITIANKPGRGASVKCSVPLAGGGSAPA